MIFVYYKYSNFQLDKGKNLIFIKADAICVLENIKDDENIREAEDNCLKDIVERKIKLLDSKSYYIYILKVNNYNKITDYKKIWKLGNFIEKGIFDDFYDLKDGRIYIGISERNLLKNSNFYLLTEIILSCSGKSEIDLKKITSVLKSHNFSINMTEESVVEALTDLKNTFKEATVIYKFPHCSKICVLRDGIQNEFSDDDLPKTEIIE